MEGLPGGVPPCGQGGSLSDGGGELMGGSRGGGCLNTNDSVWLLWEDFSSGECLVVGEAQPVQTLLSGTAFTITYALPGQPFLLNFFQSGYAIVISSWQALGISSRKLNGLSLW